MNNIKNKAWESLKSEFNWPDDARPIAEKTTLFAFEVFRVALREFVDTVKVTWRNK